MAQTQTQTDLQEIDEAGCRAHMFKGVEILICQENREVFDEYGDLLGFWDNATNTIVVANPPHSSPQQPKSRSVCVGKAEYRASASEPIKSGNIMAVMGGGDIDAKKSKTTLLFEGVVYANAQEWLAKAFKNSGKSCCVQFEKSQAVGNTPRPTRYVPPSDKNPFGCYV